MNAALNYGLFVGINYPGTENQLGGCTNDAIDLQQLFESSCQETKVVLDKDATRANILDELSRFIAVLDSNDTLIFSYSGHGTWKPDTSGDEPDGRDEALCPNDFEYNGILSDDELDTAFSKRKRGSKIIFLSDSCHSGTVFKFAGKPTTQAEVRGFQPKIKFIPPFEILEGTSAKRAEALATKVLAKPRLMPPMKSNTPKSGLIHSALVRLQAVLAP